jgi:hypothetical protein
MSAKPSTPPFINEHGIHEMTLEEGKEMLDREARRLLNISGDEFIRAWEAGEFDDQPETPAVMRLALLSEFAK